MGVLTDLPIELWDAITSYLTVSDKANLTRVNKSVQRVTESFLYQKICFGLAATWDRGWAPPLHLLLRTALDQPRLMGYVEHFQIPPHGVYHCLWTSPATPRNKLDRDSLQKIADFLRVSKLATSPKRGDEGFRRPENKKESWLHDLYAGKLHLYQALLISLLPNLRVLRLGTRINTIVDYFGTSLLFAFSSGSTNAKLPGYRQLRRIEYDNSIYCPEFNGNSDFYHSTAGILPFFYLPCVEEIRGQILHEDFAWSGMPPCAESLRILRLQGSSVRLGTLREVLAASPNLTVLDYEFCCSVNSDGHENVHVFSCHALERALGKVSDTLAELRVALQFYSSDDPYFGGAPVHRIEGTLDSLANFDRLRELEVPISLLLRSNTNGDHPCSGAQPPNLKELVLRDDLVACQSYRWTSDQVLSYLREYIRLWTHENPRLQRIGLNIEESRNDWDDKAIQEFRLLCKSGTIKPRVYQKHRTALYGTPWASGPASASRTFV